MTGPVLPVRPAVARDGGWAVVTYGEGLTCADVAEMTEIRFPQALCT